MWTKFLAPSEPRTQRSGVSGHATPPLTPLRCVRGWDENADSLERAGESKDRVGQKLSRLSKFCRCAAPMFLPQPTRSPVPAAIPAWPRLNENLYNDLWRRLFLYVHGPDLRGNWRGSCTVVCSDHCLEFLHP